MAVVIIDSQEIEIGDDERLNGVQAAARAAVRALDQALPNAGFQLEGVKSVEAFGEELIVAGVHVVDGRETRLLTGTAPTHDAPEQAGVLAVLDATNRWFQGKQL